MRSLSLQEEATALSFSLCPMKTKEERAICRPGRGLSLRSKSTDTLKLDSQAPELRKIDVRHYGILL